MELIFNELSANYPTHSDYKAKMPNLLSVCKKGKESGFSNIRVEREFENYWKYNFFPDFSDFFLGCGSTSI
jgi:hypothetical protein